ncbi:hypothetical protein BKA58DRAFT_383245 [Alternaria rosae]|uniref:uncharacterized protein n=1 Tax=Alternaria rosae TaxID=1187941 RepID=UPI001E8E5515|nr:uncharacterized protein BKA58DRAFT_383245 [Alternaria rosae]KAH6872996.1 hypothetical protein BKA58DRAFT_383245 [Alternaria rosae]
MIVAVLVCYTSLSAGTAPVRRKRNPRITLLPSNAAPGKRTERASPGRYLSLMVAQSKLSISVHGLSPSQLCPRRLHNTNIMPRPNLPIPESRRTREVLR